MCVILYDITYIFPWLGGVERGRPGDLRALKSVCIFHAQLLSALPKCLTLARGRKHVEKLYMSRYIPTQFMKYHLTHANENYYLTLGRVEC